jgi:hypothetical protein
MAAISLHPAHGLAFNEMTGVLTEHRGQGLSPAMKVLGIRVVRSRDLRWLRTVHHPDNTPAFSMNRRLGFAVFTGAPWAR